MLDTIPLPLRDLLLLVSPVILGWAGNQAVPWLSTQHPTLSYGLGALVAILGAWLTPVTRAYGLGAARAPQGPPVPAPEPSGDVDSEWHPGA